MLNAHPQPIKHRTLTKLSLSHGLMHRLPRVSPYVALEFNGWIIPPKVCF